MEFKRLSDVEVVVEPTESANVLIEENGVIKKAPKTAVGGANGKWDAVIEVVNGGSGFLQSAELISGNYAELKAKIIEWEVPNILIKYIDDYYSSEVFEGPSKCISALLYTAYGEECIVAVYIGSYENLMHIYITPDGQVADSWGNGPQ